MFFYNWGIFAQGKNVLCNISHFRFYTVKNSPLSNITWWMRFPLWYVFPLEYSTDMAHSYISHHIKVSTMNDCASGMGDHTCIVPDPPVQWNQRNSQECKVSPIDDFSKNSSSYSPQHFLLAHQCKKWNFGSWCYQGTISLKHFGDKLVPKLVNFVLW